MMISKNGNIATYHGLVASKVSRRHANVLLVFTRQRQEDIALLD